MKSSWVYNYLKQVIKSNNICITCYEIYNCGTTNIQESAKALTKSGNSPAGGSLIGSNQNWRKSSCHKLGG